MTFKERINFYFEDIKTPMGMAFDIFIIVLIFVVSAIFVIETYDISPELRQALIHIDTAIILVFIVEYLLRFWVAKRKTRHFFNIYSLVDLLAILPFFIVSSHLEFIRVFRVFRFLRLARFFRPKHVIGHVISNEDVFIVTRFFFTIFTIIFVSAGLLYHIEHQINPTINTFFDSFYFSIMAITTVGFGDIVPISQTGKIVTIIMVFAGFTFIPWQLVQFIKRVIIRAAK